MKIDSYIDSYVAQREGKRARMVTGFAWGFVAAGVMIFAFTLPDIIDEWQLKGARAGEIVGRTFLGMLVGALTGGAAADRWGRRFVAGLFSLLGGLASLGAALAPSPDALGWWRFAAGIAFGGLGPVLFAYLCDLSGRENRGRILVLLESCWALGSIAVGLWTLSAGALWGWRVAMLFPAALAVVALPFFTGPESPRYLFMKGRNVLLERRYGAVPDEGDTGQGGSALELFRGRYVRVFLVLLYGWAAISFSYYALFLWLPNIFATSGVTITTAKWFTFFVMVAQLPGYLTAAWSIERFGRKRSLGVYAVGTGLAALLFLSVESSWAFLAAALVISVFCLGTWGVLYAYTPELFPTHLRGSAAGITGASARATGIVAPLFTGWILDQGGGIAVPLIVVAVIMLIAGVLGASVCPETRREDIW
ncbi:MAG: MFS transporter [Synergistales bacterium]|nr:MFS transporter [Synergistales bacterium]